MTAASTTSLTVSWTEPSNAGPAITDYDYRHRTTSPEGTWTEVTGTTITTPSATIGSLAENTSYDVQVRATNDEGTGSWSDAGTGATDANAAPSFSSPATFDAAENRTAADTVLATDSDAGDDVTGYAITGGADQSFFSIGATDGALTFKTAPNYEDAKDQGTNNTYVVEVTATSGAGEREKTATQTTSLSAAAKAKGDAQESTAAAITTKTTTPHRVSARLSIQLEDVATVGVGNFESTLRQNLQLAMSDRLDHLGLTGDGQGANPQGLLSQLSDPTDPTDAVDFDAFVKLVADGIDGGPWAESMKAVRVLCNAATMRKAEVTFQSTTGSKGEVSAAAYLRAQSGAFFASSRMPATASNIAQCLRYRAGTMGLDGVNAMRTATCPVWNSLSIDDIYSDSASATRHITLHALIGDILITQPSAYERVDLKVS